MKESFISFRNNIIHGIYHHVLKPIFFHFDPEFVHDRMISNGKILGKWHVTRGLTGLMFSYKNSVLQQRIKGIDFENPVGLAAGFDKNAELIDILPEVGFGFAEIGSVTGEPCTGNDKPRLWRLKKSKSILVNYGLKSDGCEVISKKLADKKYKIPMGMSVAMTNCVDNKDVDKGIADFAKAFRYMEPVGNYVTINISCPNTVQGKPFLVPENLERLLSEIDTIPTEKPVFVKFAPDLTSQEIDAILDVLRNHRIDGIICTNLTRSRNKVHFLDKEVPDVGGLSGKVVQEMSDELLAHIYKREGNRFILVGCGGVFTAEDAYKKIRLGASLIQLVTGMIFEGPQVVSEINQGLVKLLKRDGYNHISEVIGIDNI